MNYIIIDEPGYKGRLNIKPYQSVILYYTNKQMKVHYPNKNFWVVGELNNMTGVQCGTADNLDSKPFPVYRLGSHNKLTEQVVGYVCVDGYRFLAVVKNVFLFRLFLFTLAAALIGLRLLQSLH